MVSEVFQPVMHLGQWVQQHPWEILGGMVTIPIAATVIKLAVGRGISSTPTTHGSARWASKKEIKKAGLLRSARSLGLK